MDRERDRSAPASPARRRAVAAILASALPAFAGGIAADVAQAQTGTAANAPRRSSFPSRTLALPTTIDLARDGALARAAKRPILFFFDRDDCPYCERALREHLVPMSREAQWRDNVVFRQVEVDRAKLIIDFDGGSATHTGLAARYQAKLTPTIVIVDGAGALLAEPIVGLLTPDFYGAYIEQALNDALAKLRR